MGAFKYENDLLKHFIRTDGWLPRCKHRRKAIRSGKTKKNIRELRYFTFCAIGAIDVLMLEVEKVLAPSEQGFESVFFFDKDRESVVETQSRIPGAVGFVGDFVKVVLEEELEEPVLEDADEDASPMTQGQETKDPLAPAQGESDTFEVRQKKLRKEELRRFVNCFPFDVINLDLEEYVFKPTEELPGKLLAALRKVLAWQRHPLKLGPKKRKALDGFSMMFTTKIGPTNLSEEYLARLRTCVEDNVKNDGGLEDPLLRRAGMKEIREIEKANFELFFKIALPKVLTLTLMEEDWYVDPSYGIRIYEFERPFEGGSYKMLHLVMDIERHDPPKHKRLPGQHSQKARDAYKDVVRNLFEQAETVVSEDKIDVDGLQKSLSALQNRGNAYRDGNV